MKILFLSGHYPPKSKGGAEISTHLIAQGLVGLGHKVTVICEGDSSRDESLDGVIVLRRPLSLTAKPLLERRHAKKNARQLQREFGDFSEYDVVHAHDFRSVLVLYELGLSDAVVTARDYAQISGDTNYWLSDGSIPVKPMSFGAAFKSQRVREAHFPRSVFRLFQYVWNVRYRARAFRFFKKQIFISRAQRDAIERHQDLESQEEVVIYNPVAQEYLSSDVAPQRAGQVLYLGRVEAYKGVDLLLEAWKQIPPGNTLTIVGRGAQFEDYKKLAQEEGLTSVEFRDHVAYEHIMKLYDDSAILISPHSWIEPFGRAVVEAMARGRVVVAADCGGPGEVIVDNETGFLFKRDSSGDLAKCLQTTLELTKEVQQAVGGKARVWVEEHLSMSNIAQEYEDFYRS